MSLHTTASARVGGWFHRRRVSRTESRPDQAAGMELQGTAGSMRVLEIGVAVAALVTALLLGLGH